MSDNSHSSKFQDVLARMKAAKADVDESTQTETSSMKVSATEPITASTIQKPKDIAATPVQFSSLKKETIPHIKDETAELDAAFEEEHRQQEARAAQIQNLIDNLLGADDSTIARLRNKVECNGIVNNILSDMIFVEGGIFMMGGEDENSLPRHQVTISSFFMCKRPLYPKEWDFFLEDSLEIEQNSDDRYHTLFVNVDEGRLEDLAVLCRRLNKITGCNFHLQTEAEHEYAARGGQQSRGYKYAGANTLLYARRLSSKTKPNELGFEYMNFACRFRPEHRFERIHGIAEWCSDYYAPYSSEAQTNPQGPANGTQHVFRSSDSPVWVRNFGENRLLDTWREADWCIRLVCDDTPEAIAAIERSKNN